LKKLLIVLLFLILNITVFGRMSIYEGGRTDRELLYIRRSSGNLVFYKHSMSLEQTGIAREHRGHRRLFKGDAYRRPIANIREDKKTARIYSGGRAGVTRYHSRSVRGGVRVYRGPGTKNQVLILRGDRNKFEVYQGKTFRKQVANIKIHSGGFTDAELITSLVQAGILEV